MESLSHLRKTSVLKLWTIKESESERKCVRHRLWRRGDSEGMDSAPKPLPLECRKQLTRSDFLIDVGLDNHDIKQIRGLLSVGMP